MKQARYSISSYYAPSSYTQVTPVSFCLYFAMFLFLLSFVAFCLVHFSHRVQIAYMHDTTRLLLLLSTLELVHSTR
jgi:hypothetical protein